MTGRRDAVAERCLQIYRDVMGVPELRATDDFFAAGGDSTKAVIIATQLESAFGVEIPMVTFFACKDAAGMAEWLSSAAAPS